MQNIKKLQILSSDSRDFKAYLSDFKHMNDVGFGYEFKDELANFLKNGNTPTGAKLPWVKTHDDLRFRPGEVTLWMGVNGHGKSELLGQACLGFIAQDETVCIASFEMKPIATLARMCKQAAMNGSPPPEFVEKFLDWADNKLVLFKHTGTTDQNTLLGVIHYAAKELKVKHFVIDSLMMVVSGAVGEALQNDQKNFVRKLCATAMNLNVHIHLVHHSKKLENEFQVPGKFDAVGSGGVSDQVDQVCIVYRRKEKEIEEQKKKAGVKYNERLVEMSDALLICAKNRHGGQELSYPLWYHHESKQFTSTSQRKLIDLSGGAL